MTLKNPDIKNTNYYIFIFLILSVAGFLLTHNLGTRVMASRAEARTAVTAREMIKSGDYVLPTLNGEPRLEKPPLYYYFVAGLGKLSGKITEFEARLPSAIAGLLTILILFLLSQKITEQLYYENKISIHPVYLSSFSAIILLTSPLFFDNARRSEVDITLTFFITLAIYFTYKYITELNNSSKNKPSILLLAAYISISCELW